MAPTESKPRKPVRVRVDDTRAIRNTARLVLLLWCGVFLALPCTALPIREALGMIESGNDDHAVGSAGEISRYQIKKHIWRTYSTSATFWDENEAWRITEKVLAARIDDYRRFTGRSPAAFDLYVLWNAPGHYHSVGYQQKMLSRVVAERATRFANLVGQAEPGASLAGNPKTERQLPVADRSAPQLAAVLTGRN
jgi:hypothetical protein